MRKILLTSHGTLAQGFYDALKLILGEQQNVEVLCAYLNPDFDMAEELRHRLVALAQGDELVIITDVLGGSVNNECMLCLRDPRVHLVAGMNLCLILELVTGVGESATMIGAAVDAARQGICYCNCLNQQAEDGTF